MAARAALQEQRAPLYRDLALREQPHLLRHRVSPDRAPEWELGR